MLSYHRGVTVSTHSLVNVAATKMATSWMTLVTALLAAGWSQQGSGDGSTFNNAAAGPVTTDGTGATGLDGTARWIRLRDPNDVREIIIERGSSATVWSLYYSRLARFTGGSPGAAARPTATDEQSVFVNSTFNASASAYTHAVVEDTAINGVWGFWLIRTGQGTSTRLDLIFCDPLAESDDYSRASLGTIVDPCAWGVFNNVASPNFSPTNFSNPNIFALILYGTAGATMLGLAALQYDCSNGSVGFGGSTSTIGVGASPWDGGDDLAAAVWGRPVVTGGGIGGVLGASHHMSYRGVGARNYPDRVEHSALDLAWVYYNTVALPWPKGTAPSA